MEDKEFEEQILMQLEKLNAKIAWHEQEAVELRRIKTAYTLILDAQRAGAIPSYVGEFTAEYQLLDKQIHEAETIPLTGDAETSYGDMASNMRKYFVQSIGRLRTRKEIVDAAKDMDASSNFPYRFLKRMLDTGELVEVSRGQYVATPKMVKKVGGI